MIQDDDYKRAKEAFFQDLHGTSAYEVFGVFAVMPGTYWLYSELLLLLEVVGMRVVGAGPFPLPVTIALEFVLLSLPTMLAFTYAEYSVPILATVYLSAAVLNRLSWKHAREYVHKHCRKEKVAQLLEAESPVLTSFRAQIMHSTCFAILAVDFTVFPRRFAKTEAFGYSVMDIGVGAFIVSSAIVSSYARSARPGYADKKRSRKTDAPPPSLAARLYAFLRPIVLVVILGFVRFATVKGVNYQEHVSEYGVHWNFYFTLAGVYLLYSLLELFGRWATSPFMAALLIVGYQLYLTNDGGEEFILHAPRDTLFEQNREGILSLIGYTALYLTAVWIGRLIFSYMDTNGAKAVRNLRWLALTLGLMTVVLVFGTLVTSRLVARPSRRMVNAAYVFWVLAQCLFLLVVYSLIQVFCLLPRTPLLFQGVSRNQLFIFLIANLGTGAVNLGVQTLYASPPTAMGILVVYMLAVSTVASVLERLGLRIKL